MTGQNAFAYDSYRPQPTAKSCRVGHVPWERTMTPENGRSITAKHLAGLRGLRQAARLALIARQPRTVLDALSIPDVGRKATRHLLAAGLLTDPERVQTRPPYSGRGSCP